MWFGLPSASLGGTHRTSGGAFEASGVERGAVAVAPLFGCAAAGRFGPWSTPAPVGDTLCGLNPPARQKMPALPQRDGPLRAAGCRSARLAGAAGVRQSQQGGASIGNGC
eukprot:354507-Chlamydomonas_euryale.AAC.9